jgi:hypothetical protein
VRGYQYYLPLPNQPGAYGLPEIMKEFSWLTIQTNAGNFYYIPAYSSGITPP